MHQDFVKQVQLWELGSFLRPHMGQRQSRFRTLSKRLSPSVRTLGGCPRRLLIFLGGEAPGLHLFNYLRPFTLAVDLGTTAGRTFCGHTCCFFPLFWLEEPSEWFFKKHIVQDVGMVHRCRICLMISTVYSLMWISCARCPGGKLTYVYLSATAGTRWRLCILGK